MKPDQLLPNSGPNIGAIARITSNVMGVELGELVGRSRCGKPNCARQVVMFLALRMYGRRSLCHLAQMLQRDRATLINGARRIERKIVRDAGLAGQVAQIRGRLEHGRCDKICYVGSTGDNRRHQGRSGLLTQHIGPND